MLFNSLIFPAFLLLTLAVYYLGPKRARLPLLLVASYTFYSFWDWRFSFLLALSTVVDYFCGKRLELSRKKGSPDDRFLYLSLLTNLGILGFFKYYGFFVGSAVNLLSTLGLAPSLPSLSIILPVGISFYTFQTLSYTIDIRNGKCRTAKSFWEFALFVSFFPQLVAGPIEKARQLLPQLEKLKELSPKWNEGFLLIGMGYFKKVLISDQIAPIADAAFANVGTLSSFHLWEGLLIFSAQIYLDFSGYTDIARGVAKLFGIDLMVNFRQPYLARNISDFWKRWHISLSSWLKEYLYIPLGGNRRGRTRTYLNLMTTMLLGGLWHGANWTFVLWGFLHGLYLSVHKICQDRIPRLGFPIAFVITQFCVLLTWLPFRAPDIQTTWIYLARMFAFEGGIDGTALTRLTVLGALLLLIDIPAEKLRSELFLKLWKRMESLVYGSVLAILLRILLGFQIGSKLGAARPFVYFQF